MKYDKRNYRDDRDDRDDRRNDRNDYTSREDYSRVRIEVDIKIPDIKDYLDDLNPFS